MADSFERMLGRTPALVRPFGTAGGFVGAGAFYTFYQVRAPQEGCWVRWWQKLEGVAGRVHYRVQQFLEPASGIGGFAPREFVVTWSREQGTTRIWVDDRALADTGFPLDGVGQPDAAAWFQPIDPAAPVGSSPWVPVGPYQALAIIAETGDDQSIAVHIIEGMEPPNA